MTAIVDGIGPRLRAVRIRTGATLEAVAKPTGLSLSTLSRRESGKRRPTLELLIPLARHYRIALDDLIDAAQTGDPRVHLRSVPRLRGGVIVPLSDYPGRVQVYKQVLAPCEPRDTRANAPSTIGVNGLAGDPAGVVREQEGH